MVVLPFPGHDEQWDTRSRERLAFLIRHSAEHITVGETACRESYILRNRYMVNHADCLLAVYDGERDLCSGVTQIVDWATAQKIPTITIHPDTAKIYVPTFKMSLAYFNLK